MPRSVVRQPWCRVEVGARRIDVKTDDGRVCTRASSSPPKRTRALSPSSGGARSPSVGVGPPQPRGASPDRRHEVDVLRDAPGHTVEAVDPHGAHGAERRRRLRRTVSVDRRSRAWSAAPQLEADRRDRLGDALRRRAASTLGAVRHGRSRWPGRRRSAATSSRCRMSAISRGAALPAGGVLGGLVETGQLQVRTSFGRRMYPPRRRAAEVRPRARAPARSRRRPRRCARSARPASASRAGPARRPAGCPSAPPDIVSTSTCRSTPVTTPDRDVARHRAHVEGALVEGEHPDVPRHVGDAGPVGQLAEADVARGRLDLDLVRRRPHLEVTRRRGEDGRPADARAAQVARGGLDLEVPAHRTTVRSPLADWPSRSAATSSADTSPLAVVKSACADRPGDLDVGRARDHRHVAALGQVDPHRHRVAPEEALPIPCCSGSSPPPCGGARRPALDGRPLDELLALPACAPRATPRSPPCRGR